MNSQDYRGSYQNNRSVHRTPQKRHNENEHESTDLKKSPRMEPYGNKTPEIEACERTSTHGQKNKTLNEGSHGTTNDLREQLERIKRDLRKQEKYTEALMRQTIGSNCSIDTIYSDESIVDVNFYCGPKDSVNATSEYNGNIRNRNSNSASNQGTPRSSKPYKAQTAPQCNRLSGKRDSKISAEKSDNVDHKQTGASAPHQCKPRSAIPYMQQPVPQCSRCSGKRETANQPELDHTQKRTSTPQQCKPRSAIPYMQQPVPQCNICSGKRESAYPEEKPVNTMRTEENQHLRNQPELDHTRKRTSTSTQCKPRAAIPYMPQPIPQCNKHSRKKQTQLSNECLENPPEITANKHSRNSTPLQCKPRSAIPYAQQTVPQCSRCGHKRKSNSFNEKSAYENQNKRKGCARNRRSKSASSNMQLQNGTSNLNTESSFCIHCLNKGRPIITNSLVDQVQKLVGNHNKGDVIVTVTLQTDGLYHINLSLMPRGDYLGCLYADKKALMEANRDKEFKQYLKIFVASDPNTTDEHQHIFDIHFARFQKE